MVLSVAIPNTLLPEGFKTKFAEKFVERHGQTTEYLYLKINNDSQELNNYFDKEMIKSYGRKEEELALILFSNGCATLQFINHCATKSDNGQAALIQQDLFSFKNRLPYKVLNLLIKSGNISKNLNDFIKASVD